MIRIILITAVLSAFCGFAHAAPPRAPIVKPGIEVWAQRGFAPLTGKRVGLITNPTGVTSDLRSTVDVLHDSKQIKLVALFGPEHGVRGDIFAGKDVADSKDEKTGVPVYSLYGKTSKPTPEMLKGLDALVYDIQDIGCRSYTYINTMGTAMEAAADNNLDFVVLDRPDPLGGEKLEGRLLDLKFSSGIGKYPIPYVYGLTCGELAKMINEKGWLKGGKKCRLHVIPMEGWKRNMWFDDTGLPWVMTSPQVPTAETAFMYPATGIVGELQVICEGVGYTLPFHLLGAPWLNSDSLMRELGSRKLAGVRFRPLTFTPYFYTHKDQTCRGVQIYITDRNAVELTAIQFHVLDIARKTNPDQKVFGTKRDDMFDKACGTDLIRKAFLDGRSIDEILKLWREGAESFRSARAKYLIYK